MDDATRLINARDSRSGRLHPTPRTNPSVAALAAMTARLESTKDANMAWLAAPAATPAADYVHVVVSDPASRELLDFELTRSR
jgi:hypothetical protein